MGLSLPKQYVQVQGKTILEHTLLRFKGQVQAVILSVADSYVDLCQETARRVFGENVSVQTAAAGETRFDSVRNALGLLDPQLYPLVAVHDAVRPLVDPRVIARCLAAAGRGGAALPVKEMADSVLQLPSDGPEGGVKAVPRAALRRVSTPQCFPSVELKAAYLQPYSPSFTDDLSVYLNLYTRVTLVADTESNLKVTTPTDLKLLELLL